MKKLSSFLVFLVLSHLGIAQNIEPPKGGGSVIGNGGDPYTALFLSKGELVIAWLKDTEEGAKLAAKHELYPQKLSSVLKKKNLRVIDTAETGFSDNYGSESYARLNLNDGVLELNQSAWNRFLGEPKQSLAWLVFHELIRLHNWHYKSEIEDDNYEISSSLNPFPIDQFFHKVAAESTFYWNSDVFYTLRSTPQFDSGRFVQDVFDIVKEDLSNVLHYSLIRGVLEQPSREQMDVFPDNRLKNIPVNNFRYQISVPKPEFEQFFSRTTKNIRISMNDKRLGLNMPWNALESPQFKPFLLAYMRAGLLIDQSSAPKSLFRSVKYDPEFKVLVIEYYSWE